MRYGGWFERARTVRLMNVDGEQLCDQIAVATSVTKCSASDSFTESDLRSKIKPLSVWTGCSELERASGCIPTLNAPLNGYWSSGIHFSSGEIMADLIALFDLECSCRSSHQLNSFWTSGLKRRGSQRACWTTLNAERSPASLIYRATCGRRALLGALLMVRTVQV